MMPGLPLPLANSNKPFQAKACKNTVAFVEGAKPVYNSKGCITGYTVSLMMIWIDLL